MYSSNGFVDNDFDTNLAIQDLYSSCLFHFPSPLNYQYEDEAIYLQPDLHDVLCQIDQDIVATKETMAVTANTKSCSQSDVCAGGGISTAQPLVKKKISAKGRHSKINTAHGPRDRRMRLSLEVAHKFFGLQDMLGLDKPSKTLEWLFKQSKNAIKEHTAGGFAQVNKGSSVVIASASSNSDCEIVSGLDESRLKTAATSTKNVLRPSSCCKNKRTRRVIRKPTFHPIPKESREKARERARERTKDKKKQKQLDDRQLTSLITWSSFGTGNEPIGTSYNNINNIKSSLSFDVEQMQNPHEEKMKSLWNREELSTAGDFNLFINGNWSHELVNYISADF